MTDPRSAIPRTRRCVVKLRARDEADARTNPFVPPDGADVVDTVTLSMEGTLQEGLRLIRLRAPWLLPEDAP